MLAGRPGSSSERQSLPADLKGWVGLVGFIIERQLAL